MYNIIEMNLNKFLNVFQRFIKKKLINLFVEMYIKLIETNTNKFINMFIDMFKKNVINMFIDIYLNKFIEMYINS